MTRSIQHCSYCDKRLDGRIGKCVSCGSHFHFPNCGFIPMEKVRVHVDWRDGDSLDPDELRVRELSDQAKCGKCLGWPPYTDAPAKQKPRRTSDAQSPITQKARDPNQLAVNADHFDRGRQSPPIQWLESHYLAQIRFLDERIATLLARREKLREDWRRTRVGIDPELIYKMRYVPSWVEEQRYGHRVEKVSTSELTGIFRLSEIETEGAFLNRRLKEAEKERDDLQRKLEKHQRR